MNKFILTGKVYEVPTYQTDQNGNGIFRFKMYVRREYRNKENGKYESDFFEIVAFKRLADFCSRNVDKGSIVTVECQVRNKNYTDKNGNKHYEYGFTATAVEVPYGRDAGMKYDQKKNAEKNESENYIGKPEGYDASNDSGDGFVEIADDNLPF